jgi:hypothetical protein
MQLLSACSTFFLHPPIFHLAKKRCGPWTAQAGKRPFMAPGGPFRPENDNSRGMPFLLFNINLEKSKCEWLQFFS